MGTRTKDLSDQVNGIATSFSTFETYLPGTLEVELNGVRQRRGVFYLEAGPQSFTTTESPPFGDSLSVQFETADAGGTAAFPLVMPSGLDPSVA